MSASPKPGPGVDLSPIDAARWDEAASLLEASVGLPRFARIALECALAKGWTGQALVDAFNVATVTMAPATPGGGELPAGVPSLLRVWADATGGSFGAGASGLRVRVRAFAPREIPLENDPERTGFDEERGGGASAWPEGDGEGAARASGRLAAVSALGVRAPLEVVLLASAAGSASRVNVRALRVRTRTGTMRAFYLELTLSERDEEGRAAALEEALARWLGNGALPYGAIRGVFRTQNALYLVDLCDDARPSALWAEGAPGDGGASGTR